MTASTFAREATEFVQDVSTQLLFDHSRRVFLTGFKAGIVEAFSPGMRDQPETAFGTMNTDILDATLPGYVRPNFCDFIRDSRFAS